MSIGALLPLASLAFNIGSKIFSSSSQPAPAASSAATAQPNLSPTLQSLFSGLGANNPSGDTESSAINHFMSDLMQELKRSSSGQSLPDALASLQQKLSSGTAGSSGDNLQRSLSALEEQLGMPQADLGSFISRFRDSLQQGSGQLLSARA